MTGLRIVAAFLAALGGPHGTMTNVNAETAGPAVSLTVSGTRPQGRVLGQVFADAASFRARTEPALRFAIEPQDGVARTVLHLPAGRFAIVVFQDVHGTGRVETNMVGMPTVPYGFSNDARGSFGPPGFDAAAFAVPAAGAALAIRLR